MVELFTAIGFADGRRGGQPRFRLSPGRKLPTPAALNELAEGKPEPHGRDSHPLCAPKTDERSLAQRRPRRAHLTDAASFPVERGRSASPLFSSVTTYRTTQECCRGHRRPMADWIERRDCSETVASPLTTGACNGQDYSDEPPLNWANHSRGTQLEGPAQKGSLANSGPYPRLMRPRFPDPLSPSGDASSNRPYSSGYRRRLRAKHVRDVSMTTAAGRKKPAAIRSIAYFAVFSKLCYGTRQELRNAIILLSFCNKAVRYLQ
jgi:hypothetical protein